MAEIASLVRWIITYSVSGGLWHFIACYLVLVVLVRVFAFVRVTDTRPKLQHDKAKARDQ